jgi:PAS domain S-box-containing protein
MAGTVPERVNEAEGAPLPSIERLLATKDWGQTSLGAAASWPSSLQTVLRLMLASRYPMWLGWGPDLLFFCNDAYREQTLGAKYPRAIGLPFRQVWPEVWDDLEPRIRHVMTTGEATLDEGLLLFLERSGYPEETYHSFSYSPAPADVAGEAGGLFCVVVEETERVLGERRIALLGRFASMLAQAKTAAEVFAALESCLSSEARDLPFSMTYLVEENGPTAKRTSRTGFDDGHPAAPRSVNLAAPSPWPIASVLSSGEALVVDLDPRGSWPVGAWKVPPSRALLVPIARQGDKHPAGVFVAGLNPHRVLDDRIRNFVGLLVGQLGAGLSNAGAYEEARKRAEALAEIDRAKTTFFSNVSHEFRTPLTLMLGPIEDMRALPPRDLDERERVALLHRNALRLLKLVNTLLDFSRIEAGRTDAAYEPTDLSGLTADLASSFRSAIERAGLTLQVECPPLSEPLHVDRDMWEKIVLNLLSNAFKFTFQGTIAVRLREVQGGAELEVSDTGTGIAEKDLPRIFERFHRVEGAKSRSHEGSGIGLALVQELVRLHGGELRVQSRQGPKGAGTSFFVRIPAGTAHLPKDRLRTSRTLQRTAVGAGAYVQEALRWISGPAAHSDTTPPAVAVRAEGSPRERILVVDDNADMRDYVSRLLHERWDVEATNDGQAALESIRRNPPDLVLTDVMMPGLDGFGLLRALRSDAATREIPVVMLSARAGEEATSEGLKAGADDYLVKPFTARELFVRIAARLTAVAAARDASVQRANLYRTFMQAPFPVGIFRGPQHVIELANDACLSAWGRGPEIIGRPLRQARPEILDQPFPELLDEVYGTGTTHEGREQLARVPTGPAGELQDRYFNFVYAPLRDARDKVEGVMVCSFEVTEQVRAKTLLTTAQKAGHIGIFDWDGHSDAVYWSSEIYELLGRTPEAIAPTVEHWTEFIHPEEREAGWNAFRQACASRVPHYEIEQRFLQPDGSFRWLRTSNHLTYDEAGRVTRCLGVAVDVQRLKDLAERERAARFDAEEANRAKDDFLAMLGHELRNPLSPIMTAVHLLKLRAAPAATREVHVIERQTEHLTRLVDDLLDVSRITRGKVVLNRESVEVADVVAAAIEMAGPLIENGRHQLVTDVPTQGLVVDVDRVRMAQVVANLLTNAAKYTMQGGRITVSAESEGRDAVIHVQDTGAGISAELLPRVFDLFVQARQTLARAQGGLGLGLAIVKNLVAMHGGSVSAASEGVGRGSTFTVRLPLIEAHATERDVSAPLRPTPEGRLARVLVVDDNVDDAEMLAEALHALGYRTAIAHDGPQALEVAAGFEPQIALLDIGLPVMDGYELAARLREQRGDLTLVAITGYGQDADRERARDAGFDDHLTKPVDLDKLGRVLELSSRAG